MSVTLLQALSELYRAVQLLAFYTLLLSLLAIARLIRLDRAIDLLLTARSLRITSRKNRQEGEGNRNNHVEDTLG